MTLPPSPLGASTVGVVVAVEPIAVDKNTACRMLGIQQSHLMDLVRDGDLAAKKLGRRTVFTVADLRRFVSQLPSWEPQT